MGDQLSKLKEVAKSEELKYLEMGGKPKTKERKRARGDRRKDASQARERRYKMLGRFFEVVDFSFQNIFRKMQENRIVDYYNLTFESFLGIFNLSDEEK